MAWVFCASLLPLRSAAKTSRGMLMNTFFLSGPVCSSPPPRGSRTCLQRCGSACQLATLHTLFSLLHLVLTGAGRRAKDETYLMFFIAVQANTASCQTPHTLLHLLYFGGNISSMCTGVRMRHAQPLIHCWTLSMKLPTHAPIHDASCRFGTRRWSCCPRGTALR